MVPDRLGSSPAQPLPRARSCLLPGPQLPPAARSLSRRAARPWRDIIHMGARSQAGHRGSAQHGPALTVLIIIFIIASSHPQETKQEASEPQRDSVVVPRLT